MRKETVSWKWGGGIVVGVAVVEKSSSTREPVRCAGCTNATSNAEPIIQITRFVEVTTFVDGMQL